MSMAKKLRHFVNKTRTYYVLIASSILIRSIARRRLSVLQVLGKSNNSSYKMLKFIQLSCRKNYANYRGTYLLNSNHTECSFTTTHFNFNDGNGWVDNGPPIRTALYSMVITHSSYSGSLISSTDTTLNSLDFSYIRVD